MMILPTRDAIRHFRVAVGDVVESRDIEEIVTQIFGVFMNYGVAHDAEVFLKNLPDIDRINTDFSRFGIDSDAALAEVMHHVYMLSQELKNVVLTSGVLTTDGDFPFGLQYLYDDDAVFINIPY